jgi:hypothetical protein
VVAVPGFVLLALVFWSFGDRISGWAGLRVESPCCRFALSTALSYGAVTLLVFLLATLRGVTFVSCIAIVVAMAVISFRELRANTASLIRALKGGEWKGLLRPRGGWQGWATWLSGFILILGLVQALAPVTGMDTGSMHFAAVKIMLGEHGLSPRPEIWFHRTGGFYMVYLFGMALQGEALAKLLSFGVSPLALLLVAQGSERLRAGTGRIAAAVVALTPLFTGFTGYEYLELPVLMYLLAAFLSFDHYRSEGGLGWAVVAATLIGLAVGVKITAFPVMVFLIPMILAAFLREGSRALIVMAAGGLGFCITAGFWPIWNWATTGSFVFSAYLETPAPDSPMAQGESWWISGIVFFLGSLVTTSEYWTDSAGPLVIAALAGVFLFRAPRESRLPALLVVGSAGFYLAVLMVRLRSYLFVDAHARYLGPCLLGFGALAAAPFIAWAQGGPRWLRMTLIIGLLLPAAPLVVLKAGKAAVAAPAAFGLESRSHYLSKKIETYEACEVLNALPEKQVKVLFMAQRPYYLDRPMVPEQFWEGLRNREDLVRRARQMGVTHVLFEPAIGQFQWLKDPEEVFKTPTFREIGRWPWKQRDWVRLYAVEKP